MGVKVGDIVRVVSPGSSRNPGTVKAITPGISRGVEVEFTGTAWFYPYRSWFTESELVGVTDAAGSDLYSAEVRQVFPPLKPGRPS